MEKPSEQIQLSLLRIYSEGNLIFSISSEYFLESRE